VSWLDTARPPHFDISISSSPDEFILKPVAFYEMPDRLWYPLSSKLWNEGRADDASDRDHHAGLLIYELTSSVKRSIRHTLRQTGADRLRAYYGGKYLSSSIRGFHKSRIDDGFDKHERRSWRAALTAWKQTYGSEVEEIERGLAGLKETYLTFGDALAGKSRADEAGQ
jgi:hypothetical protein